jgi:DNA recombination protein RmuC
MTDHALLVLAVIVLAVILVLIALLLLRTRGIDPNRIQTMVLGELRTERQVAAGAARDQRAELQTELKALNDTLRAAIHEQAKGLGEASDRLRDVLSTSVKQLQDSNEKRLDEMRATVDEKLEGTLEKRLGESFARVSERLEAVHQGLGEMRTLATGVGDLKKVLSNVSTRGTFGEVQLRAILEQILSPDQYRENFTPREDSGERVEFAVVLPGRDQTHGPVFLPIDSKFPQEDFVRLVDASARVDAEAMMEARTALIRQVRAYARTIAEKYIAPPATTDFAILFLPTEGLYAEVLRQPGLVEDLQRSHSIAIVGPTTLAAFLNSLRMGFRTLALEQRSSQVWQILGAVKTEFAKFGQVVTKLKKQLGSATATLDETSRRTRAMERKLSEVEQLPPDLSARLIGLPAADATELDDEDLDESLGSDDDETAAT